MCRPDDYPPYETEEQHRFLIRYECDVATCKANHYSTIEAQDMEGALERMRKSPYTTHVWEIREIKHA